MCCVPVAERLAHDHIHLTLFGTELAGTDGRGGEWVEGQDHAIWHPISPAGANAGSHVFTFNGDRSNNKS